LVTCGNAPADIGGRIVRQSPFTIRRAQRRFGGNTICAW
jgi:hypothetical protein